MEINNDCVYVAIKVEGLEHWLWFEVKNITLDSYTFIGKKGWGKEGAFTEIKVQTEKIQGWIYSNELQYE